mgnify:CR=1 FL=1
MGKWTLRSKIVNTLLLGEVASPRMAMEKWIGNKEGSLIPRGRETRDRIQGHKLWDSEEPRTTNMAIRMLTYTGCNWIVAPDPIKAQPKWHIWGPLQWTWRDPYVGQGSKAIPFFQFTTRLAHHILTTQTDCYKDISHISCSPCHDYWQVLVAIMETTSS